MSTAHASVYLNKMYFILIVLFIVYDRIPFEVRNKIQFIVFVCLWPTYNVQCTSAAWFLILRINEFQQILMNSLPVSRNGIEPLE